MANRSRWIGTSTSSIRGIMLAGAGEAEHGVEFVDVAVGFDTRIALRDAAAAEQAGVTGVAGAGIDLHYERESNDELRKPRRAETTQRPRCS